MAMVISFDVGFTERCSSPIWFSTGPEQTPTHWKQTILWLNDENQQKLMVLLIFLYLSQPFNQLQCDYYSRIIIEHFVYYLVYKVAAI